MHFDSDLKDQGKKLLKRKAPDGIATTDLILSSYTEENDVVFEQILALHVPLHSTVADVTYGKGVFWRRIDLSNYKLLATDLKTGTDCRHLPYQDDSLDCVVLDPPYMEGLFRQDASFAGGGSHSAFKDNYSNGVRPPKLERKWHDAVVELYVQASIEAKRVLKKNGVFIVKCQDEVSANTQRLTHIEIVMNLQLLNFYCKDLFVVTRRNKPGATRVLKQTHARKNHSYFLVFIKDAPASRVNSIAVLHDLLPTIKAS